MSHILLIGLILIVLAVVLALDLANALLHLADLPFPLLLAHLALPAEQLIIGLAIGTTQTVPQRCVLTKIIRKIEVV